MYLPTRVHREPTLELGDAAESHSNFFSIASTALASSRLAPRPPSSPLPLPVLSDDPSFLPVFLSCAPAGRCHASVAIWHTNDTNSSKSS